MGFKLATLFREYHDSIHEAFFNRNEIPILEDFGLRASLAKVRRERDLSSQVSGN